MTIRAVFFDLGGVLETERETGMDAKWEIRLGLKHGELEEQLFQSGIPREATLGRLSEQDVLKQLRELFGLDNDPVIVEAARDVGMQAIQFDSTTQAIADIRACLDSSAGA